MRSFEHDGIRLAYDVVGEGLPVVLHLGAAGDSRAWREAGYVADFQISELSCWTIGDTAKVRLRPTRFATQWLIVSGTSSPWPMNSD
jgi:hypothetical protein